MFAVYYAEARKEARLGSRNIGVLFMCVGRLSEPRPFVTYMLDLPATPRLGLLIRDFKRRIRTSILRSRFRFAFSHKTHLLSKCAASSKVLKVLFKQTFSRHLVKLPRRGQTFSRPLVKLPRRLPRRLSWRVLARLRHLS